ncbi:MAG: hypothetical protein ABIW77_15800 [Gelidibacter sp.]|uniref:hypothetical protein n=1 Tax=Gelidibacter sp. TaxID=2018083 RepID=UPI00326692A9
MNYKVSYQPEMHSGGGFKTDWKYVTFVKFIVKNLRRHFLATSEFVKIRGIRVKNFKKLIFSFWAFPFRSGYPLQVLALPIKIEVVVGFSLQFSEAVSRIPINKIKLDS